MTADLKKFRQHLREHIGDGSATTYVRIVTLALTKFPDDPLKLMTQKHLSHSTKHSYQAALRHWAEFSKDKDLDARLHAPQLRRDLKDARREEHRTKDRHLVQPFSPEQEQRIYSVIQQWREDEDRPVWQWVTMSMMFSLGLRAGVDLAYLAKRDVESALRSGVELVIVTKGSKERTVPAVLVLEELQTLSDLDEPWEILADLIVSDRTPNSPRKVANAYERLRLATKKLAEEAGIAPEEMHPHRFRHNVAQRLYAITKDIEKVKDFLGHEDVKTTQGYLHKNRTADIGEDLLETMRGFKKA